MRRAALSLTLALALGASVVPAASAAFSVIDQSQEEASLQAGWEGPGFPDSRIGQTFTAGLTGDLVAIGLYVWPGYSLKGAVLEVRDVEGSLPGDLLLSPKTIGTSADGWIRVPVGPLHLVAGERYLFLLRRDVGPVVVGTGSFDVYPGGDLIVTIGDDLLEPDDDLAFRTYMAPSDFEWVDAPAPGKALRPNAGATVKASFRLGGDYGLGVLKGGFPKTTRVKCGTTKVVKGTTFLTRPFGGKLDYDDVTDTYTVSWKARPAWAKGALACRQLEVLVRGQREVQTLQYRLKPVLPPR
ncbi:MAG: PxKF domain-containing protein [Chloroflexi bacterium]|nr:PxKF domain-containing protein [Chloroflexota bacterium]